jgi:hypothetical protein
MTLPARRCLELLVSDVVFELLLSRFAIVRAFQTDVLNRSRKCRTRGKSGLTSATIFRSYTPTDF